MILGGPDAAGSSGAVLSSEPEYVIMTLQAAAGPYDAAGTQPLAVHGRMTLQAAAGL